MLPEDHLQRMGRVRLSLEGLSLGDAFGHRFFFPNSFPAAGAAGRVLPSPPWHYTDDTVMGLGIAAVLCNLGRIDCDVLAREFATRFVADPCRGYGGGAIEILTSIAQGMPWKSAAGNAFGGMGSKGNGAAMRAAPVGAYFADEVGRVVEEAYKSAEVTHAHMDGQVGSAAVALAASFACTWTQMGRPNGMNLLTFVADHLPKSEVRDGLLKAIELPPKTKAADAAQKLGCGHLVTAPDTVPFALWCAWTYRDEVLTEGLWQSALSGGDVDTTTAIVGSVAILWAVGDPIPPEWNNSRERIPHQLDLLSA